MERTQVFSLPTTSSHGEDRENGLEATKAIKGETNEAFSMKKNTLMSFLKNTTLTTSTEIISSRKMVKVTNDATLSIKNSDSDNSMKITKIPLLATPTPHTKKVSTKPSTHKSSTPFTAQVASTSASNSSDVFSDLDEKSQRDLKTARTVENKTITEPEPAWCSTHSGHPCAFPFSWGGYTWNRCRWPITRVRVSGCYLLLLVGAFSLLVAVKVFCPRCVPSAFLS